MASSVHIGEQLERFIAEMVTSGRYNSKSELIREGVRLIEARERRLAALDHAITRGLGDAATARVANAEDVLHRLERKADRTGRD